MVRKYKNFTTKIPELIIMISQCMIYNSLIH